MCFSCRLRNAYHLENNYHSMQCVVSCSLTLLRQDISGGSRLTKVCDRQFQQISIDKCNATYLLHTRHHWICRSLPARLWPRWPQLLGNMTCRAHALQRDVTSTEHYILPIWSYARQLLMRLSATYAKPPSRSRIE